MYFHLYDVTFETLTMLRTELGKDVCEVDYWSDDTETFKITINSKACITITSEELYITLNGKSSVLNPPEYHNFVVC